eukprot:scaffold35604_cov244-Amphora_coffeaeformis.AAC.2
MKAAIRTGFTGLTYAFSKEYPLPAWDAEGTNAEDVYLKVNAAGMNPVDYKAPKLLLGAVYGIDCCGTIEKVGSKVNGEDLKVGDVVVGPAKGGSMAQYTVAVASKVTKVLPKWSVEQAAALPTAYDTAMTSLDAAGILQARRKSPEKAPIGSLLVIGASGGCGLAMLHLAKGMGIPRIVGICSSRNVDFCKQHGATQVVTYDDEAALQTFYEENEGTFDMVYDTASFSGGGEAYSTDPNVMKLLKANPTDSIEKPSYLVLNGSTYHWLRKLVLGKPTSDPRMQLVLTGHSSEYLRLVLELMNKANAKPVIDSTFELTDEAVQKGYQKLKSRRVKGKLIVKMAP